MNQEQIGMFIAELLNGWRLNKEELEELKITINNLLEYSTTGEINRIKKVIQLLRYNLFLLF